MPAAGFQSAVRPHVWPIAITPQSTRRVVCTGDWKDSEDQKRPCLIPISRLVATCLNPQFLLGLKWSKAASLSGHALVWRPVSLDSVLSVRPLPRLG